MDDSILTATDRAATGYMDDAWRDISTTYSPSPESPEPELSDEVEECAPDESAPTPCESGEIPILRCSAADAEADADSIDVPQIIEALLFAADTPLSAARLADLAEAGTPGEVRRHIETLNERYAAAGLSFRIESIARGYQMMTLPEYRDWLARLDKQRAQTRLSGAAMETLSIVAYKQPIIRADVEAIRGVACGDVLNRLREMGLVRVVGRAEVVGRPMLYGTTRKFLDVFGLAALNDLPPLEAQALKAKTKRVAEVEPISPPVMEPAPLEARAVAGA